VTNIGVNEMLKQDQLSRLAGEGRCLVQRTSSLALSFQAAIESGSSQQLDAPGIRAASGVGLLATLAAQNGEVLNGILPTDPPPYHEVCGERRPRSGERER